MFGFKKKETDKVISSTGEQPKVKFTNPAGNLEKLPTKEIVSTDCRWDSIRKVFSYTTDLVVEVPEGQVLIIYTDQEIAKENFFMPGGNIYIGAKDSQPIVVEFKSYSGRFVAQPFDVGEVIANFIVVPIFNK